MILNGMLIQQLVGKVKRRVADDRFDLWSIACMHSFDKASIAFQNAITDPNKKDLLEEFLLWAWYYPVDFEGQICCVDLGDCGSAVGRQLPQQRHDLVGDEVWQFLWLSATAIVRRPEDFGCLSQYEVAPGT
jgi:hypothetical protein